MAKYDNGNTMIFHTLQSDAKVNQSLYWEIYFNLIPLVCFRKYLIWTIPKTLGSGLI